eukprot:scaffold4495_cov71-Cylindrotheca_fusiformis.AAC.1
MTCFLNRNNAFVTGYTCEEEIMAAQVPPQVQVQVPPYSVRNAMTLCGIDDVETNAQRIASQ